MQQDQGPQGQSPNDEETFQPAGTHLSMGLGGDHEGDWISPPDMHGLLGIGGDQTGDSPVRFASGEVQDAFGGPPDQAGAPGLGRDNPGD